MIKNFAARFEKYRERNNSYLNIFIFNNQISKDCIFVYNKQFFNYELSKTEIIYGTL